MPRAAFFVQATALLLAGATLVRPAHAELPLELVVTDSPGTGFHDAKLGEARTAALQAALDEWAQRLDGLRSITVEASFAELPCTESSVVLARGESAAHMDLRDAAYPMALARTLSSEVPALGAQRQMQGRE